MFHTFICKLASYSAAFSTECFVNSDQVLNLAHKDLFCHSVAELEW